jgi:hypothetical protein
MTNEKLAQIAYAQGWIEGRLEDDLSAVQSVEEPDEDEVRHRQEMLDAFMLVSNALDTLRRENANYEIKLTMVRGAIQL